MALTLQAVPVERFTWIKAEKKLVGEVSDLGGQCMGRIWNDSCDEGILIQGKYLAQLFILDRVEKDGEGDIVAWHYRLMTLPRGQHLDFPIQKVVVLND